MEEHDSPTKKYAGGGRREYRIAGEAAEFCIGISVTPSVGLPSGFSSIGLSVDRSFRRSSVDLPVGLPVGRSFRRSSVSLSVGRSSRRAVFPFAYVNELLVEHDSSAVARPGRGLSGDLTAARTRRARSGRFSPVGFWGRVSPSGFRGSLLFGRLSLRRIAKLG